MKDFDLDYRYIKAFSQTAKHLNFSKAAKELNIAQSAVSRQIKLLEESLGVQLIIRSSKKVVLTDKGHEFLSTISVFENKAKQILQNSEQQLIRVGILHGLLETWFIPIIRDFSKTHLQLQIETGYPEDLKDGLLEGKYDLVFTPENIQNDLVTSLRIFEEKLVMIGPKNLNMKALRDYTWIVYNNDDVFLRIQKKHSPKIIKVNSITAIIKLVNEGVGIAVVPDHTIRRDYKFSKHDIKPAVKSNIYLSTLNFKTLPEHTEELVSIIRGYL
jgi:DNA-binding transcriptional LysR family regulator